MYNSALCIIFADVQEQKNYYEILGVPPSSSYKEIKAAYHRLALLYHPDRNAGNATEDDLFKDINEAYNILSDSDKRASYNRNNHFNTIASLNKKYQVVYTASDIYKKLITIQKVLEQTDPYRMNKKSLYQEIQLLFSSVHLAVLKNEGNRSVVDHIIDVVFLIIEHLSYPEQLAFMANFDNITHDRKSEITAFLKKQKQLYFWKKYKPFFVLGTAIGLCIILYLSLK